MVSHHQGWIQKESSGILNLLNLTSTSVVHSQHDYCNSLYDSLRNIK